MSEAENSARGEVAPILVSVRDLGEVSKYDSGRRHYGVFVGDVEVGDGWYHSPESAFHNTIWKLACVLPR